LQAPLDANVPGKRPSNPGKHLTGQEFNCLHANQGAILLVSNFTLHGDCKKGRRPGFDAAAEPQLAQQLYEKVIELITGQGITVEKGAFGKHMHVSSINDGPVTFLLDSSRLF